MKSSIRIPAATASALVGALLLAGCGSEPTPPQELDAVNLGVNGSAGDLEIENLLLVTSGEGSPARLIGVLLNHQEEDVEVTIADADDEVSVSLEPGQQFAFQETPTILDSSDDIPGSLVDLTVTAGDDSTTLAVPVRDGSLGWLAPYVPE